MRKFFRSTSILITLFLILPVHLMGTAPVAYAGNFDGGTHGHENISLGECTTVSFVQPLENVDGDTSSWSSDDTTVSLGTSSWNVGGDDAVVTGYNSGSAHTLSHRGTRGLGVDGQENDEVDSKNNFEEISIVFNDHVFLKNFEVRSLFANEGHFYVVANENGHDEDDHENEHGEDEDENDEDENDEDENDEDENDEDENDEDENDEDENDEDENDSDPHGAPEEGLAEFFHEGDSVGHHHLIGVENSGIGNGTLHISLPEPALLDELVFSVPQNESYTAFSEFAVAQFEYCEALHDDEDPGDPICGNEVVETGEQCDDGNTENGDGCSDQCLLETDPSAVCGNGIKEIGEQCDGNDLGDAICIEGGTISCTEQCTLDVSQCNEGPTLPICGNEVVETGEQCDDGNTENGDGCSDQCTVELLETSGLLQLCKWVDTTGDGFTEDDAPYTEGWGMSVSQGEILFFDGTTGENGCVLFELNSGSYTASDETREGWVTTDILVDNSSIEIADQVPVLVNPSTTTTVDFVNFQEVSSSGTCGDELDNDLDTLVDTDDPACHTDGDSGNPETYDPSLDEENGGTCSDGLDNNENDTVDADDPACHSDNDETNPDSYDPTLDEESEPSVGQCEDGQDNDGDELIDSNDPDCHTDNNPENPESYDPTLDEESEPHVGQCEDGIDNESDGFTDANDPDCHTDGNKNNPESYDPNREENTDDSGTPVTTTTGGGGDGGGGGGLVGLYIHTESLVSPTQGSVTITWHTNKPATSRLVYGTVSHDPLVELGPNYGYTVSTAEDTNKVTFHSITLTGLDPLLTYYLRPLSKENTEVHGVELTISLATENTEETPQDENTGGTGGPTTPTVDDGTPADTSGTSSPNQEPIVLGLTSEAQAQETLEEDGVVETDDDVEQDTVATGAQCSGLWFFPAIQSLPFPWCKWWPVVLVVLILVIYWAMRQARRESGDQSNN